jgi:hypothetical protein
MDTLFGDPFYYNIINHLHIPDIYILKCVCTHYNKTITQSFINQITINNIRKDLHNLFGDEYEENIKKIKKLELDNDNKFYNKYFIINVHKSPKDYVIANMINNEFNICRFEPSCLHIKENSYDINIFGYCIKKFNNRCIYLESLDGDYPHLQEIKKQCWGNHNEWYTLHWIKNDSDKVFNLLELL